MTPTEHDRPNMDNPRLIVVSETVTDFKLGIQLAFRQSYLGVAWSWWIWTPNRSEDCKDRPEEYLGVSRGKDCLVFGKYGDPKTGINLEPWKNRFPMAMNSGLSAEFAWAWLLEQDYGREPDHDGSDTRGFILFNDAWGHLGGDSSALIAVAPAWAMQGK